MTAFLFCSIFILSLFIAYKEGYLDFLSSKRRKEKDIDKKKYQYQKDEKQVNKNSNVK